MSRRRHLENLPPDRNRIIGGLHALAGMTDDRPSVKGNAVAALRAAGIGASWHGTFVYAEMNFARAWERIITRYKTVPMRGVRLTRAIASATELIGETSEHED